MAGTSRVLILPALNEAQSLAHLLAAVSAAEIDIEVLVVDDGSRDNTASIASAGGARVIRHPFNLGYGIALQSGYKYALRKGAAVVVQMDADGQHDPREIPKLLAPIERGEADLVVGSRFLEPGGYEMGRLRTLGREIFRGLARLTGLEITDPTSGFQALNRAVLELYAGDFYPSDYPDVDVLVASYRHGLRVRECAVNMSPGSRPSSMHGGFRSLYYVYKMVLSTWAASAGARRRSGAGG